MSFPWSINYFFSTALNASNTITSAVFQPVTFLVNGNTELKSDTVINHLGIKKIPNASYSLDVSGNVNISGSISGGGSHTWTGKQTFTGGIDASANQVINFGTNAPTMSGANIGSATIPNSALQSTVTLNNTASTFSAKKTFTGGIDASSSQVINFGSNAPTMSGAGLSSQSIPDYSLSVNIPQLNADNIFTGSNTFAPVAYTLFSTIRADSILIDPLSTATSILRQCQFYGGMTATSSQTINFGTNAVAMSGSSIVAGTIPNSALQSTVTLNNTASTFSAKKTFTGDIDASGTQTINLGTNAPTMSGANIGSTTIPNSALQSTVTLNNTTSTFSAKKTFTGGIDASGTQTITFGTNAPTMSGANIGSATIPYASLASDVRLIKTGNSYNYYTSNALSIITTGDQNTVYGSAGAYITDGGSNALFGLGAGNRCGTTSSFNVAIGIGAMGVSVAARSICSYNIAVGTNSLGAITTGSANVVSGWNSANVLTTGSNNTFIGSESGINVTAGNLNTGVGYRCNYTSPAYDGSNNTFLGANAALSASVSNTTCIGANTLCSTASTIQLGSNSETVAISGSFKSGSNTITATQLGYLSGVVGGIVDTSSNLTIGGAKIFSTLPTSSDTATVPVNNSLIRKAYADATYGRLGTTNTWSSVQTFNSPPVMSGDGITAASIRTGLVGTANASAIKDLYIDTSANCALGNDSMISITSGVGNCALSTRALKYCSSGSNNMGIGTQALASLTSGVENVGISTGAMQSYNGNSSVGIGAYSGYGLLSGDQNVMIGYYSGGVTTTSASSTVCIGNNAGTGSATLNSCVFIGNATTTTGTKTNAIVIGAGQATASNDCIIGDSNNNVKIAGTLAVTGTINSVSSTVFGYISGLTSSAQTQINNILNGTTAFTGFNYNSVYTPYSVGSITAGGTWTSSPLAGTYLWSASATASTNTTITLPSITTAMIGVSIRFRRIANASSTNALLVLPNTTGSNVIYPLGSVTTQTTSTTIIFAFNTSTFGQNGYSGTLVCVNATTWAIM